MYTPGLLYSSLPHQVVRRLLPFNRVRENLAARAQRFNYLVLVVA